MRHEFKSKVYSIVVDNCVECFYEAYDKGHNDCLYDFLTPRVKHELCYIDDDGAFEISCYDDIIEHIRYSHIGCNGFKELSINFLKQLKKWF